MASAMATSLPTPTPPLSSSSRSPKPTTISASLLLPIPRSHLHLGSLRLGSVPFSPWIGLKHLGTTSDQKNPKGLRGRCKGRVVYASLFGVGAPEALVIGVVALLVFGPKGLAEVARTLGKTLRAFQPTIRELQDVSREFKSTLEKEIGLDEVQSSLKNPYISSSPMAVNEEPTSTIDPNGAQPASTLSNGDLSEEKVVSSGADSQAASQANQSGDSPHPTTRPYSSEDLLSITQEQLASSSIPSEATNQADQPEATKGSVEVTSEVQVKSSEAEAGTSSSTSSENTSANGQAEMSS